MNDLAKVLVVDHGDRRVTDTLSTELAELGLSSVTTSFEAAEDVLQVIDPPAAIFIQPPRDGAGPSDRFARLAEGLRADASARGIPVIVWTRASAAPGALPAMLASALGSHVAAAGP